MSTPKDTAIETVEIHPWTPLEPTTLTKANTDDLLRYADTQVALLEQFEHSDDKAAERLAGLGTIHHALFSRRIDDAPTAARRDKFHERLHALRASHLEANNKRAEATARAAQQAPAPSPMGGVVDAAMAQLRVELYPMIYELQQRVKTLETLQRAAMVLEAHRDGRIAKLEERAEGAAFDLPVETGGLEASAKAYKAAVDAGAASPTTPMQVPVNITPSGRDADTAHVVVQGTCIDGRCFQPLTRHSISVHTNRASAFAEVNRLVAEDGGEWSDRLGNEVWNGCADDADPHRVRKGDGEQPFFRVEDMPIRDASPTLVKSVGENVWALVHVNERGDMPIGIYLSVSAGAEAEVAHGDPRVSLRPFKLVGLGGAK